MTRIVVYSDKFVPKVEMIGKRLNLDLNSKLMERNFSYRWFFLFQKKALLILTDNYYYFMQFLSIFLVYFCSKKLKHLGYKKID